MNMILLMVVMRRIVMKMMGTTTIEEAVYLNLTAMMTVKVVMRKNQWKKCNNGLVGEGFGGCVVTSAALYRVGKVIVIRVIFESGFSFSCRSRKSIFFIYIEIS